MGKVQLLGSDGFLLLVVPIVKLHSLPFVINVSRTFLVEPVAHELNLHQFLRFQCDLSCPIRQLFISCQGDPFQIRSGISEDLVVFFRSRQSYCLHQIKLVLVLEFATLYCWL
jgi:hypothetical protein